jgi:iron complex transport system permease protein
MKSDHSRTPSSVTASRTGPDARSPRRDAVLSLSVVGAAGAIGFIGLVLPHAACFLVGPRHNRLIPVTAVLGAVLLVWVDALARTVFAPQEVPVGVVTALIGVPAFALLLFRTRSTP